MSDENNQNRNTGNGDTVKETVDSVKDFVNNTADTTSEFDPADIEKNKTVSGLAYILFFLPLIICPGSKFGRYHANQALVLLLASVIGSLVLGLLYFIPVLGWLVIRIYQILMFVLFLIGLLNGLNGKAKELPVIGKIKLF